MSLDDRTSPACWVRSYATCFQDCLDETIEVLWRQTNECKSPRNYIICHFAYSTFHSVYLSHTTLDNNNWIFSISTSSHSVMGSSNHKIIIWGPLPVYNHGCKSPSHLFAFSFWLRPRYNSAKLNLNWDWFLWQRALFNKGRLYLSCAGPQMPDESIIGKVYFCTWLPDRFDSREGLSRVSCFYRPAGYF